MSWLNLNQSLNSLKGQITNFASEVLSEGTAQDSSDSSLRTDLSVKELEEKCTQQELEIAALKKLNDELQATLQSERLNKKNGVREEESNWYWDPPAQKDSSQYESQIKALQNEITTLKENDIAINRNEDTAELSRLREENQNLTKNLEDLDHQHQLAMEKLLTLKKELQKNFEVLKEEHEHIKSRNEEFMNERQLLLNTISERDKQIEQLTTAKTDFETLHHKYVNLEKVHTILRENAEKFQEENQELHEEIFKLQEMVTKYEHEIEVATKHTELSNVVPREAFDELLKEVNDLKKQRHSNKVLLEETNIDDNAKSVIENLKRQIHDLESKLVQKENQHEHNEDSFVKADKIMQLYNKYVNFEIPVDYIGEMPPPNDNVVMFKLKSVFKAINAFKKEIDTLEHRLSEKNHDINHMQTQIDDLTSENDFLTTDIQHFESEVNEMRKNNDFLINELAVLKNSSKLEPIIESHEDNIAKLENELDNCTKKNKSFESEIKRIEKELAEVQSEKKVLQENLADMRNKYTTMLGDFETIKAKTTTVEELQNSTKSITKHELKKAVDEIDALKKRLTTANAKNEELAIDLTIINNDKVLLAKEIDDLKQSLKATVADHQQLNTLKNTLENKLGEVEKKLDEILKNKNEIEVEKNKLQERLSALEKQASNKAQSDIEKIGLEKRQITERLKAIEKENRTLTETTDKLNHEISELKKANQLLEKENESLKNNGQNIDNLQETIKDLKAKLIQQEVNRDQFQTLKEENQKLMGIRFQLETDLTSTDHKIKQLESDFDKLYAELNEKDTIIDKLSFTIDENNSTIANLNQTVTDLNNTLEIKNQELQILSTRLKESMDKLNESSITSDRGFEELNKLSREKEELQAQIMNLNDEIQAKTNQLSSTSHRCETIERTCNEYKATIDQKDIEIIELNQSIASLNDKIKDLQHNSEKTDIIQKKDALENEISALKNFVKVKEEELAAAENNTLELKNAIDKYKEAVEVAAREKNELINLVNLKHNESIQYHNEIQRLNGVILEQTNEHKILLEKEKELNVTTDNCTKCEEFKTALVEKDQQIMTLHECRNNYDRLASELKHANDTIANLTERCENLDKNLGMQLEAVKKLTAENAQLSEKEQNSTKELERLRRHLVETNENFTQELMASEQKLTECQTRLHQVEERAKQTSTVYTSNSIRANQEVETLRNQIRLLEKQREDVQARLSEAEDARNRSEAALTNLQVVLEQFQLDKERDIHTATEKIRNKMEEIKSHNDELRNEISRLNTKLEEALNGLQAAARLGDQVETKSAQINDLKEQVRTLQMSVAAAEERYYNATSNQQDKVDKNLVKNLIINYVMTAGQNATNKTQVLRILSTVLDFNQQECERLGLVRSSAAQESLAAEFVKFLQNESKPRAPLPNMMGLAQGNSRSTTPSSRKNSTLGPSPLEIGHSRNPSTGSNNLLFQNIDNIETSSQISIESETARRSLETGVTQTRDTEGAILKHVLRDM